MPVFLLAVVTSPILIAQGLAIGAAATAATLAINKLTKK